MTKIETLPPVVTPVDSTLWGLDVESTGLTDQSVWHPDWRLRTVQLAPNTSTAYVIRTDDAVGMAWVTSVLSDPANVFVTHGQLDALAVRKALGVDIFERVIDTQVLTLMTAPDDRLGQGGLKNCALKYGFTDLVEAEQALNDVFLRLYKEAHPKHRGTTATATVKGYGFTNVPIDCPEYVRYAGLDAVTVLRILPLLIRDSGAPKELLTLERWLSAQALGIAWRGQLVDSQALETMEQAVNAAAEAATATVVEATGGLKPGQYKALGEWFAAQGVDFSSHPRTDKGSLSFAKENLTLLRGYDVPEKVRPVVEAFIRYSQLTDKLRRTAEIRRCMDGNGYVHSTLNTVGAVTGRMTASQLNMQNFSKKSVEMRLLFKPEPGHVLISCDFSQVEARVTAALAQCKDMLRVIAEGGDLHQLTADKAQCSRQKAKTLNFQVLYGVGFNKLAGFLGCSVDEAREYLANYWRGYPEIAELNERLKQLDVVTTLSGRKVPAGISPNGSKRVHANLNYMVQGSSRELLAGAWRRFACTPDRAKMVWFPIHDELVLHVPENRVKETMAEVQSAMTFDFFGVQIDASADVLVHWDGSSRWMTGDYAVEIAAARAGQC